MENRWKFCSFVVMLAPVYVISAAVPRTISMNFLWKGHTVSILSLVRDEMRFPSCCENRWVHGSRTLVVSTVTGWKMHRSTRPWYLVHLRAFAPAAGEPDSITDLMTDVTLKVSTYVTSQHKLFPLQ